MSGTRLMALASRQTGETGRRGAGPAPVPLGAVAVAVAATLKKTRECAYDGDSDPLCCVMLVGESANEVDRLCDGDTGEWCSLRSSKDSLSGLAARVE
ncbi:hypothetical protein BCR44DRAFT_1433797 [Catenaria anguillulae PL171]|uniref:Uncharacterized protein n=1 Tax=Catenaria anguillulae PL171 TaxID=765915 RepID=A0A1Y2HLV4_9FUNG|nr:hypothetical protein BCR44DRAFT_1433797 [Catenaria anguillulae PL171]